MAVPKIKKIIPNQVNQSYSFQFYAGNCVVLERWISYNQVLQMPPPSVTLLDTNLTVNCPLVAAVEKIIELLQEVKYIMNHCMYVGTNISDYLITYHWAFHVNDQSPQSRDRCIFRRWTLCVDDYYMFWLHVFVFFIIHRHLWRLLALVRCSFQYDFSY